MVLGAKVKMRKFLSLVSVLFVSAVLNFGLFAIAYNKLATPYLHEAQRTDNAEVIIFFVLPGFAVLALISTLLTYVLSRKLA
jgi:hypothetical protein